MISESFDRSTPSIERDIAALWRAGDIQFVGLRANGGGGTP
jgi:hypothetical protein